MNMVQRKHDDSDTYSIFCYLKAPRRMIENFTPSQLYQTTMWNCLQRASSEIALPTEWVHYRLECFQLTTWKEINYDRGLNQMNIGISHHKTNSLDTSLLQRESHLVFLLRIASIVDRAKSLPERTSWLDLVITFNICDNCIPVVSSALKYLLNTLCYFHSFLPFDCSMYAYEPFSCDFDWKSTWPLRRFDIPDFLLVLPDTIDPYIELRIGVRADSTRLNPRNRMLSTGSTASSSYDQSTGSYESHTQLLPKS